MTSYREAGVDLDAADRHTDSIGSSVTRTWTNEVVGGFGGFAAGVRVPTGYVDPVLMMTTDGVGTKLEIARRAGLWGGVGRDLVAMCVDDLAAAGSKPIGFVDYLAVGSLDAERDTTIVDSIADACLEASCPLLGGETAEHPGVMEPAAVDLAGAALGVVESAEVLGPERVGAGDLIVGLMSPNLRSNGFSLVRAVMGADVDKHAGVLVAPSVIYSPDVLQVAALVNSAAHITGGGLASNIARALPPGLGADIDTESWVRPEVFDLVASYGVAEAEMWRTFNNGIGFCLVAPEVNVAEIMSGLAAHNPAVVGRVREGDGVVLT